jgi:hypothetical protein
MKDSTKKTVRTAVQSLFLVAALAPVLLSTLGVESASGVGAAIIAGAAALTRLHAVPAVSSFLNKYFGVPE